MNAIKTICLVAIASLAIGCGPSGTSDDDDDGEIPELPDEDGDNIADEHEGQGDTDGDGIPDFQDDDSDGDGISDLDEAGDILTGTPPLDSDSDGTPDFRDLDSDDNGIADGTATDTTADLDSDGVGNWKDLDDDGDTLLDVFELDGMPGSPPDQDGDGVPNFHDDDSDGDTILDSHEVGIDVDLDDRPAYVDNDSDGDCRTDAAEAGDTDKSTAPVDSDDDGFGDFLDLDSDNDGLADTLEDPNCDGVQTGAETSAIDGDSDDDGVTDLIEVAAGTNPLNPADNPQANGDFVFLVPYEAPPDPSEDDLGFSTNLQIVDVYVLIDRSGSMLAEINSVRNNLSTAISRVTCPPLGTGNPADCIADVWSGGGTIGYSGVSGASYTNHIDIQPDPAMTGPAIPTNEPSGCCAETSTLATWSAATGLGSASSGCSIASPYGARASCNGSPAGSTGIGYPCFRSNALPVILLSTDEPLNSTFGCPSIAGTASAVNAIGGKVVGIQGNGGGTTLTAELQALATQTGAVDAGNGNMPLVFNGADANQVGAIENAIKTLASGIPLDMSATTVDDPSDAVDAITAFVDHLVTLQLGTPQCTSGLTDQDTNGDGYDDLFVNVRSGTPVCWQVVPKVNQTVMPTTQPQLFRATVQVHGDGVTLLDQRDVYFLVPPVITGIDID